MRGVFARHLPLHTCQDKLDHRFVRQFRIQNGWSVPAPIVALGDLTLLIEYNLRTGWDVGYICVRPPDRRHYAVAMVLPDVI